MQVDNKEGEFFGISFADLERNWFHTCKRGKKQEVERTTKVILQV